MISLLILYVAIGLIFIGFYFTGCWKIGASYGFKIDFISSLICIVAWPYVIWTMSKGVKND